MKKFLSFLMATIIILVTPMMNVSANDNISEKATNSLWNKQKIYDIVNKVPSEMEYFKITTDLNSLKENGIDVSSINKINITPNGNEFILDYGFECDVITVENITNGVNITVKSDDKKDVLTFYENGMLKLDGFEIHSEIEPDTIAPITANDPITRGVVWKGTKSLKPYGSLKESDYNDFLASGKQNIPLGKALDSITASALGAILAGVAFGYTGFTGSLTGVAKNIIGALISVNSKTRTLGCKYQTYIAGMYDYKYLNFFYTNKECTGAYETEISYEHFIVY